MYSGPISVAEKTLSPRAVIAILKLCSVFRISGNARGPTVILENT